MRMTILSICCLLATLLCGTGANCSAEEAASRPLILAHYMPWFEARPVSPHWGWHWTMNAFDPEKLENGKPQIAAHFHPLIGPYDSSDERVLEYQLLTMKMAGIDGVIVDWYGLQEFRDYALLHRNTVKLVEQVERVGMKIAICYEDQTIPALVEAGRVQARERVGHASQEIEWMARNWFSKPSYVQLDQRPVLLSFGQTGLTDAEWTACLKSVRQPVSYFSLHHRRQAAIGAFDWPIPQQGIAAAEKFSKESRDWPQSIPVAFPRFVDIYSEAKVGPSYGRVDDRDGQTFRKLFDRALNSKAPIVQIATWNDWGEGTSIEPSHEFGYRDLEVVQAARRRLDSRFAAQPDDLRLPHELLNLRRKASDAGSTRKGDEIAARLAQGQYQAARKLLGQ